MCSSFTTTADSVCLITTLACFWTVAQGFDYINLIMSRTNVLKYQTILDVTGVISTRRLFEVQEKFQPLLSNNTDNNSDYISPAGRVRKSPWEGSHSQLKSIICCPAELRDSKKPVCSSCWHPCEYHVCGGTLHQDFYSINTEGALLKAFNDGRLEDGSTSQRWGIYRPPRQDSSQLGRHFLHLSLFSEKDIKTECWHDVSDSDRIE